MMSIKGMGDPENGGSDSHPILRAHNYKKPQLEKLNPLGGGGGGPRKTVTLTDYINQENKMHTLVLKGCPFRANENEVKEFFEGFDLKGDMEDSIFLQQENGRKDGKGAVIFKSE